MTYQEKNKSRVLLKLFIFLSTIVTTILVLQAGAYAVNLTAQPAVPNTDTQVRLSWTSAPGAASYAVFRDGGTTPVKKTTINDQNYLNCIDGDADAPLIPETTYSYIVKAYSDIAGTNIIAGQDSAAVPVRTTKMIKPSIIYYYFDIATREVYLSWLDNSFAANGSIVRRVDNGNVMTPIAVVDGEATFTDPGLGTDPVQYEVVSRDLAPSEHFSVPSDAVTIVPVTPPVLTASMTNGVATVSWGPGFAQISSFQLERSSFDGTTWSNVWQVVNSNLSGSSATNTPATPGMYRYRLNAKALSNYNGYVMSGSVIKPAAPQNLSGLLVSRSWIELHWNFSALNYSNLQVERRTGTGSYVKIADILYNEDEYTDIFDFTPNTTYSYRVVAYDSDNNKSVSNEISISTAIPAAPTNLGITVTNSGTNHVLAWSDNSNSEIYFRIERSEDGGEFAPLDGDGIVAPDTTSYTVESSDITAGKSYKYRVAAYNPFGLSNYSNEVSVNASSTVYVPNSLTVKTVSASQLDLAWTYPGTGSYITIIERKTGMNGSWSVVITVPAGTYKYSDTHLAANTEYFYRVRCQLGSGLVSDTYPAGSNGTGAFTKLGGLSLAGLPATGNTIYLSWTGNSTGGDVIIERKMANGGFAVLTTLSPSTTAWYDNTGLVPGAVYTYRIKAKNLSNESVYSNEVSVTNTFLNAPTGLTAFANTTGGIDLTWYDNSTDESGFEIWRMVYGASNYTLYATVDKNTVKYTDEAARTGVQYYYMVRAYIRDSTVYSGYTNTVSIGIGMIGAPANLKYSYVSSSQVVLSWTDTASNESGFKVEWKTGEEGNWTVLSWLSANTTSYTATGLSQYSIYYFRIRAYSYSGNIDSVSSELEVSTALPNAPSDISAAAVSSSRVNIKWKDNSGNESGFRIMRRTSAFNYYTAVGEVGPNVTSYSDSNLYSGITYIYKVVAFSASGSSESREASATTGKKVTFSDLGSVSWAKEAIENLAGRGIISGKGGNRFMPGDKVTKAEFVAMIMKSFKLETVPVGSLADVKVGKWYYKDVMTAEYFGIISIDENNRFYPDRPITRQEIALIIFKTLEVVGKPLNGYDNSVLEKYRDKDLISPYALSSMASLVGEGVMSGVSANSLAPQNSATRAEAAVFIYKVIDR